MLNHQYDSPLVRKALSRARAVTRDFRYGLNDLIRLSQNSHMDDTSFIVNDKEIRVVGLRRSGNHAILNWIRKQHKEETLFINNVKLNANPYQEVYEDQVKKIKDPMSKGWKTDDIDFWRKEAQGKFTLKSCLVYSYEDYPIQAICNNRLSSKHDLYVGKSRVCYDVILLRDPFNLFASRIKANQRSNYTEEYLDFIKVKSSKYSLSDLWIDFAREYLGETQHLKNIKVPINYNLWTQDKDYRKKIAQMLDLEFSDDGFNEVMTNGGGSSFDGTDLSGKASKMPVHERWKSFANDPSFRNLIENSKILEYSLKIFGQIPGTESLYN